MRYHVATAGECEAVRQAINAGWRAGPATHAEHYRDGVLVGREPLATWEARTGRPVGEYGPLPAYRLIVAGADAVLELPEDGVNGQLVSEQLGVGIVPAANQLAQVTRAREHSQFATGIRDVLDDRYVRQELGAEDTPAARGRVTAELQGGRAAAALARFDAQAGAQAIERALGGRS